MTRNFLRFSALALLLLPVAASAQVGADPHAATLGASAWLSQPRSIDAAQKDAGAAIELLGDLPAGESAAEVWLHPFPGMHGKDLASLTETVTDDPIANHGPWSSSQAGQRNDGSNRQGTRYLVDASSDFGDRRGDGRFGPSIRPGGTRGGGQRGDGKPTGGGQTGDPTNPVPEPATVMLLASGLLTVGLVVRARALA